MEEKILLQKLRDGNVDMYQHLFDEYYNWLCNYLYKLSGNKDLAEDLVQDVMLNIWEKRKVLVISTSLKNYLFKSSHNQFLMHVRKERKNKTLLDEIRWDLVAQEHQNYFFTEKAESDKNLEKLQSLIAMLPPKCREIFVKSKIHNVKYKDIAEGLGISIKTVEGQMSKALNHLRQNVHNFFL